MTAVVCFALAACKHSIAVDPIEVKPIHLTLDINLKVDRELDEFFDYDDEAPLSTTVPATMPAASAPSSAVASDGGEQ